MYTIPRLLKYGLIFVCRATSGNGGVIELHIIVARDRGSVQSFHMID